MKWRRSQHPVPRFRSGNVPPSTVGSVSRNTSHPPAAPFLLRLNCWRGGLRSESTGVALKRLVFGDRFWRATNGPLNNSCLIVSVSSPTHFCGVHWCLGEIRNLAFFCPPWSSDFMAGRTPLSAFFLVISAASDAGPATATVRSCARCHSQGNARRRNKLLAQLCADSALRAKAPLPSALLWHCLPQHPKSQGPANGLPTATHRLWRTVFSQLATLEVQT